MEGSIHGSGLYRRAASHALDPESLIVVATGGGADHDKPERPINNAPDSAHGGRAYLNGPNRPGDEPGGPSQHEGPSTYDSGSGTVVVMTVPPTEIKTENPVSGGALHGPSVRSWIIQYFKKWGGVAGETPLPIPNLAQMVWSWLGSFLSILAISAVHQWVSPSIDLPLLVASFGASAVLLFGVPESKLAQPRNFLGGHVLSALIGVVFRAVMGRRLVWLAGSLAMATSLVVMQATQTVHPPGGATALIAGSALDVGDAHGFRFLLTILFASALMLAVALVLNNMSAHRRYPTFWW
mmetsp:Transcript_28155/g.71777  ORF Transcript_28155/g.71777 Transcript_28155/m.71777 type:complete len:296 (-) Transcript_28155:952-1839(-)